MITKSENERRRYILTLATGHEKRMALFFSNHAKKPGEKKRETKEETNYRKCDNVMHQIFV